MRNTVSSLAIESYLPDIRRIFSFFEMELLEHQEALEKRQSLYLFLLEKEIPIIRLVHAGTILNSWLEGTQFSVVRLEIRKTDPSAQWADMFDIIEEKLLSLVNQVPLIELTLSSDGHISRMIGKHELSHDFEGDSKKVDLLKVLSAHNGFMDTIDCLRRLGDISPRALSDMKKKINDALRVNLKLPKDEDKDVIVNKRSTGYRINGLYNVVSVR